jgi:hypothetical protein
MKWYHVTTCNWGSSFLFQPRIPGIIQKGEDRNTPRICITDNWKHSLRSIMLIHLDRYFYVYSTTEKPIDPTAHRQNLIDKKQIRKTSNNFCLPSDGFVNKEHWFLTPTLMTLEGHIRIPEEDYVAALIGLGMFNYPDPNKMKLIPGSPVLNHSKRSVHELEITV